jgi:hypothetical protein
MAWNPLLYGRVKIRVQKRRDTINLTLRLNPSQTRMPTNFQGFQRVIIRGIPAWKKEGVLYYYDDDVGKTPLNIGTVVDGFVSEAVDLCSTKVQAWRATIESRNRSSGTPAKKK